MDMLIIVPAVLVLGLIVWAFLYKPKGGSSKDTRYGKSGNFMDFDPGVDSDKVGDPKYPNAGIDSVMKHEYLEEVTKEDK